MIIQEHTPTGIRERELTTAERLALAKKGDVRALKEIIKEQYSDGLTVEQKVDLILKLLGIKTI